MRQISSIVIVLVLLACSLASWQVVRCTGSRCGVETRQTCFAGNDCSKSSPTKKHCGQKPGSAATCWLCFGNCCYYLVPSHGFLLRSIEEEEVEKPQGLQHRFPQSFYHSVWHPPAPAV